jgi:renal tumor antigen
MSLINSKSIIFLSTMHSILTFSVIRQATHMEFNFPRKEGTGIAKLIPNVSPDATDVITKMLNYTIDNRMSAGQALKHAYFRELRE